MLGLGCPTTSRLILANVRWCRSVSRKKPLLHQNFKLLGLSWRWCLRPSFWGWPSNLIFDGRLKSITWFQKPAVDCKCSPMGDDLEFLLRILLLCTLIASSLFVNMLLRSGIAIPLPTSPSKLRAFRKEHAASSLAQNMTRTQQHFDSWPPIVERYKTTSLKPVCQEMCLIYKVQVLVPR